MMRSPSHQDTLCLPVLCETQDNRSSGRNGSANEQLAGAGFWCQQCDTKHASDQKQAETGLSADVCTIYLKRFGVVQHEQRAIIPFAF